MIRTQSELPARLVIWMPHDMNRLRAVKYYQGEEYTVTVVRTVRPMKKSSAQATKEPGGHIESEYQAVHDTKPIPPGAMIGLIERQNITPRKLKNFAAKKVRLAERNARKKADEVKEERIRVVEQTAFTQPIVPKSIPVGPKQRVLSTEQWKFVLPRDVPPMIGSAFEERVTFYKKNPMTISRMLKKIFCGDKPKVDDPLDTATSAVERLHQSYGGQAFIIPILTPLASKVSRIVKKEFPSIRKIPPEFDERQTNLSQNRTMEVSDIIHRFVLKNLAIPTNRACKKLPGYDVVGESGYQRLSTPRPLRNYSAYVDDTIFLYKMLSNRLKSVAPPASLSLGLCKCSVCKVVPVSISITDPKKFFIPFPGVPLRSYVPVTYEKERYERGPRPTRKPKKIKEAKPSIWKTPAYEAEFYALQRGAKMPDGYWDDDT